MLCKEAVNFRASAGEVCVQKQACKEMAFMNMATAEMRQPF
jgi:hypothetical protein